MSFLGNIENLMNGSGLEEAFEEVYSEDKIKHILSGHAAARALRAHIQAQSALVNHIRNTLIDEGNLSISGFESFYSIVVENWLTKEQIADASNNDAFINMVNAISNYSKEKSKESRRLGCGFFILNTFTLSRNFLLQKEDVIGIYLHLQALMKTIKLFAAYGHEIMLIAPDCIYRKCFIRYKPMAKQAV